MTPDHTDRARKLLEDNLDLVQRVLRWTNRRLRFSPEDAEELRSIVFLKLVQDDYAVLRKFRGQSSLRTYLTTVVQRQALDYRDKMWGKWRPSMAARRLGKVARQLEDLIAKDARSVREAIEILKVNHRVGASRRDLERLADRLPIRVPRRHVEVSDDLAARERADAALWRAESRRCSGRACRKLVRLLESMPGEDRLIFQLRFEQGVKICRIASMLGLEARPLYRRIERRLGELRRGLEAEGVTREAVTLASAVL